MKTHIINIGDELLIGDTINTNASWMASALDDAGFEVMQIKVIGDKEDEILNALEEAFLLADLVLITGGLGPTHDDITKHTLCKFYNDTLVKNKDVYEDVEKLLAIFSKEMNALNMTQAMVPSKCEIVRNMRGTAPGMIFEDKGKIAISMPGVPHEMRSMMTDSILPKILKYNKGFVRQHKYLKTFNVAEADLAEMLEPVIKRMNSNVKLAFLPTAGQVKLRLSAIGNDYNALEKILQKEEQNFAKCLGNHVYGYGEDTMESVIGELLKTKEQTIATAESCTGGRLASKITSIAGSSIYYAGSVITYSNEAKTQELGISSSTLEKHGAVSEKVVVEMAKAVRIKFNTDIGLSTSGIAGPDGGTEEKPVGTIWIAFSCADYTKAIKINLNFSRKANIELTTNHAMELLRTELMKKV